MYYVPHAVLMLTNISSYNPHNKSMLYTLRVMPLCRKKAEAYTNELVWPMIHSYYGKYKPGIWTQAAHTLNQQVMQALLLPIFISESNCG